MRHDVHSVRVGVLREANFIEFVVCDLIFEHQVPYAVHKWLENGESPVPVMMQELDPTLLHSCSGENWDYVYDVTLEIPASA